MKYNILSNQIENENLTSKDSIQNLIRVLSRISTIPKLDNIDIISSSKDPEAFKINPGKSITIGNAYLNNPVTTLLYIRYGIEWQVWYRAFQRNKNYSKLIDLAALIVTKHFYDLLLASDKESIDSEKALLPSLCKAYSNLDNEAISPTEETVKKLASFHGIRQGSNDLDKKALLLIKNFAKPTEYILMEGGDERLKIDEINLLNKYGCTPFPRPEALTFASSTATSISNFAYDTADISRSRLITSSLKFGFHTTLSRFTNRTKARIRNGLGLGRTCEVILSPSGTDSSLQLAALSQISTPKTITHILVGSDETGSGVSTALHGNHFEASTALNYKVTKGDRIEGFRDANVVAVPLRSDEGILRNAKEVDEQVLSATKDALANDNFVVLHVIDQSKLGFTAPSGALIREIEKLGTNSLQIIIDASQLRIDSEVLKAYLSKNYIITITGSKFFTGPPYSGALLIPNGLRTKFENPIVSLPDGLKEYYNRLDWPKSWRCVNNLSKTHNLGALMRWRAATAEMLRYFNTPLLYRNIGIEMFCSFVHESINECKVIEPLYQDIPNKDEPKQLGINNTRSIFPFFVWSGEKLLTSEQIDKVYRLLNSDLSAQFKNESLDVLRIASRKCHIGQGVKVVHSSGEKTSILRISLGARVISESWQEKDISLYFRNIQDQMNQVNTIIKKIELISSNFNKF